MLAKSRDLCKTIEPNNKDVPVALKRQVFAEYGLAHAETRAYEVDYLITPALGGADDIRNLWPHSNTNTEWNAKVKDALESQLRTMVCDGQLDLATAQRELATNWIDAYKKYFHTDRPIDVAQ
ncbi:MAG: HNH endonuclease [Bryobacterales bacterium]|nr:HNH endonuclease [Bryobacterales bacterium]